MDKLSDFSKTGRFFTREDFEKMFNTTPPLNHECTDVILYWGGFYIECLKDNTFYVDIRDKKTGETTLMINCNLLDFVESILWETQVKKLMNKSDSN